jgi:hypothetical protein
MYLKEKEIKTVYADTRYALYLYLRFLNTTLLQISRVGIGERVG